MPGFFTSLSQLPRFLFRPGGSLPLPESNGYQTGNRVGLNELLADELPEFQEGSVRINYRYSGCQLVLSAGLTLTNTALGLAFDELFTRLDKQKGNRLEALWWVPTRKSRIDLVLSNTSYEPISATIQALSSGFPGGQKETSIDFQPRETKRLKVPQRLLIDLRKSQWKAGSLAIEHTGEPGDLVARGYVWDRNIGFSSVLEFSDPLAAEGTELHGTGLRFATADGQRLFPVVVARNLAETESILTVRVPYTTLSGESHVRRFENVRLEAGEVRNLAEWVYGRFNDLSFDEIATAGLEISYSTDPGTVLVSALTVGLDGNQVFRVPLVDPLTKGSAGNYPWKITADTSTFIHLKNTTEEVQKYTVQIDFEDGGYVLGLKELSPGQTTTIDIQSLSDNQVPDQHGTTIPLDAMAGQIHWSVVGPRNHSMIGRSEYINTGSGLATTFSCASCCPNSYYDLWVNPSPAYTFVDGSISFVATEQDKNCYGQTLLPYQTAGQWTSSNIQIMFINFTEGEAEGNTVGHVIITVRVFATIWYYAGHSLGCQSNSFEKIVETEAMIRPTVLIYGATSKVPMAADDRASNLITLNAEGNPSGGSFQWSTTSNRVSLVNTTSSVVTVQSVSPSGSINDVQVKVVYTRNGVSSNPSTINLTVVKPNTLVRKTSQETYSNNGYDCSSQGLACNSYKRRLFYDIKDQLGSLFNQNDGFTITIDENYSNYQTSCGSRVPVIGSQVGNYKQVLDNFWFCSNACNQCNPSGSGCVASGSQAIIVNGYTVRTNQVTWSCSDANIQ